MLEHIESLIQQHRHQEGGLMLLLHSLQDALGYVPAEAVAPIAKGFNLTRAEVHGVITYYHHFRSTPPGRTVVQVCRAESCKACGSDELMAQIEQHLGVKAHETRADGAVSLEPVYCLGLCAQSPAIQVNDRLFARVTTERLPALLAGVETA
ncbi:MAG: formate dehydrogenase subunit gamma [Burkholderiales bacterium]|jgi:formate dehydrogenase subunit gamma|uniref:formate dehydrogenase subunit gamma n=1 Tax=Candidatus Aalborgicola defluviihabitans TaxID=3386187 RepID=UPI001D2F29B4|nr:formate dehydrogenase subunit gamma [Burkholderiales bacterium]MBK7314411.1 formate dehydrogenase subunit gamma [Burkholderiales bacterium]MBL0245323.1 formate dehydrogenase subunit gamma [Rhodoferax sp.]